MILELLVGTGLVLAGAAAARVVLRRRSQDPDAPPAPADGGKPEGKRPKRRKRSPAPAGPRGLRVGDVILYADTELWLAGMVDLDEEGFAMRLFPSPGSTRAEWVAQLDEAGSDLATLSPTEEVPGGPVPEALPIGGRRLTLERRGNATVRTAGEHLPRTSPRARYAMLSDAGGRVLLVVDFDKAPRLALVGDRVGKHMIDLLPGGDVEES